MHEELGHFASLIRNLNSKGHNPCTSGNYSLRSDEGFIISASGIDKEFFKANDFIRLTPLGDYILLDEKRKPSDETHIHRALYQVSDAQVILHSHHLAFCCLSDYLTEEVFTISNLEMIKAFSGKQSHKDKASLRVYDNTQDIEGLSKQIEQNWPIKEDGLLLKHHGLYVWGNTITEAKRHLETWLYLAEYYLRRKI